MTIDTQWRYRNTAVPTQTFENPEDFFDNLYTGAIDAEDVKKHKDNNLKNVEAFDSYLLADKRTVVTCRRFKGINEYNEWKYFRALLTKVDFNVSEEEGDFIFGIKTGNWKTYWDNGNLKKEGIWKNGKANGLFKFYNINGDILKIETIHRQS